MELCQGVYGKELFHSIKRAGHHAKHSLILMKWPVYITNRLALAIAGLWWGGKESHTLLASDCATVRADQLETWTPPSDHKIEAHARPPASFLVWLRYAENQVRVFGAAYGIEHMSERLPFVKALHEAHDEDEHAYPVQYCIDLFEELNAVWAESVRESRRVLCAKLGTENPRLEDLKLIALVPGEGERPNFQFLGCGIYRTRLGTTSLWWCAVRREPSIDFCTGSYTTCLPRSGRTLYGRLPVLIRRPPL